jgi:hypothetical protein
MFEITTESDTDRNFVAEGNVDKKRAKAGITSFALKDLQPGTRLSITTAVEEGRISDTYLIYQNETGRWCIASQKDMQTVNSRFDADDRAKRSGTPVAGLNSAAAEEYRELIKAATKGVEIDETQFDRTIVQQGKELQIKTAGSRWIFGEKVLEIRRV